MANQMAYFDKERYATEDAVRVGRLHVETDGWEEASLDYLNSGGYTLSPLVSQVAAPTLMIWGENDEILDVQEQVPRFQEELRCPVQLQWIKDSGHVPHLEKPAETAKAIQVFLDSKQ
ncbi:Lipase 1 [Durusdinium trenchii]